MRTAALLLLLVCCSGCVRLVYSVRHVEDPLAKAAIPGLQAGRDDLGSCLQKLGAPHFAWEYRGNGVALGYVYSDAAGWSLQVSYSPTRFVSASFSLDLGQADLPGAVLWFDADLRLLEVREGRMRELTRSLRTRPAAAAGPAP